MDDSNDVTTARSKKKAPPAAVPEEALPPVIEAGSGKIEPAATETTPPIEEAPVPTASVTGVEEMATAVESFPFPTEFSTEGAKAIFEDAKTKAKDLYEKSTKAVEEATEMTKGNVEALVASGRAAAKGTEAIMQDVASYSRKSFDTASSAVKSFAGAKTPTELFQLQSDYAKASFDSAVAEASKVSEAYVKLFSDVFEPLSGRIQLAAEKIKSTIS